MDEKRYPGYVMRQSLVNEINIRTEGLQESSDVIYEEMKSKELESEEYQHLNQQYHLLLGKIRALRDLYQWAVSHDAPPKGSVKQC